MGENALFYQKHIRYPGLVKPYQRGNGSIERDAVESTARTEGKSVNRMNELSRKQKQIYDPFSRYDDDSGEDHYFLVPGAEDNSSRVTEWRRTVKSSRSLKNIAKLASDIQSVETTVGQNRTKTYPPYYKTPRTLEKELDEKELAGDYCYISSDQSNKGKHFLNGGSSRTSSYYFRKDGERLQEFASKFANSGDETPKPQSSHSFGEGKFDTWVELEGINETGRKTHVTRTQPERVIDYCTCMICVKGIFYHCTDEDDDIVDNVCSCNGSKGSVFKRWTCLSILACFMPCLFCHLPAKGCLNLCRKCKGKDRRSPRDSNLTAKFKKPNERRPKETTTLL